jgi:hypothetical protein
MNDNAGAEIFRLLLSGSHWDIKIMKNNSTFSPSLALYEQKN